MGSACCKTADEELQNGSFNEVSGVADDQPLRRRTEARSSSRRDRKHKSKKPKSLDESRGKHLEDMMLVLFNLHDLNSNGFLEEDELVQLNSKVAMLHHGKDTDVAAVKAKYRALFREKLDPDGQPVLYAVFRKYVLQVLDGLDPDPLAQEMIVEQFAAEARSARAVFHVDSFQSQSDQLYLSKLTVPSFATLSEEPSAIASATSPEPTSPCGAGDHEHRMLGGPIGQSQGVGHQNVAFGTNLGLGQQHGMLGGSATPSRPTGHSCSMLGGPAGAGHQTSRPHRRLRADEAPDLRGRSGEPQEFEVPRPPGHVGVGARRVCLPALSAHRPGALLRQPRDLVLLEPGPLLQDGRREADANVRENRFSIQEGLGAALVVRSSAAAAKHARGGGRAPRLGPEEEELALLDLLRFGGARAALRGACEGTGGGGIARVLFDATRGLLLLLGLG
eukprot:CAMPEP_0171270588 /NCGR_PEP_ID=MMETSP0790-20130122/60787_1 /TAXON_ID=2925 /ORGANISM="Alexandrium catenella, Strain OF101" /LENGTH=447 /DNA_ID=CAMNT_0011739431 /DNA_START=9 /DNA_END=1350 /DNA_ORIENTATION=+